MGGGRWAGAGGDDPGRAAVCAVGGDGGRALPAGTVDGTGGMARVEGTAGTVRLF